MSEEMRYAKDSNVFVAIKRARRTPPPDIPEALSQQVAFF
jgi:hypothetical protein